jgi:hypothetical protein
VSINSGANSRGCFQPDCHQQCWYLWSCVPALQKTWL